MKSCSNSGSWSVLTTVVCLQSSSCSVGIGHPESSGVVATSQCFLQGSFEVLGQCESVVL